MVRTLAIALVTLVATGCTITATTGNPNEPAAPAPAAEEPAPAEQATPTPAPAKHGSRSRVKQSGDRLQLSGPIFFETGKANILPTSEATLEDLRLFLEEKSQITGLRIEGHTDSVGQPASNLTLSGERAKAVKTWLVNRGIASTRLISVGFGDTKPIADNNTEQGKSQNRRTDFVVVEVGGKAWRGAERLGGGTEF